MLNLFAVARRLRTIGLMGLGQRNAEFILRYNKRRFYPRVDDKLITKQLAIEAGLPVPELYAVESFATVHQMSSRVQGRLLPGAGLPGLMAALFPCGSVTGAPKIRAMEIIAEVEAEPRGVYCGAVGWAAPVTAR